MIKEPEILNQIKEKHRKLSHDEQSLLTQLVVYLKSGEKKKFNHAKHRFLDLLEKDLHCFFGWDTSLQKRQKIRHKFLNIAGLYNVIPHEEILQMLKKVFSKIKRPIGDMIPEDIFSSGIEIDAVALKHLSPLAEFLSIPQKTVGVSYLDFISGNRATGKRPVIHHIVFDPNIAQGNAEENYLSASSETFTKTVFISTHTNHGAKRDWIGIAYDLVTQSAFVDFFHTSEKEFHINKVLRNSMIIGTRFVENTLVWLEKESRLPVPNPMINKLQSFQKEELDFLSDYISYLESDLMGHNLNLVSQLNEKLGLPKDDFKVHL